MSFDDNFKQYISKVKKMQGQLNDLTEEATKNALVMPFFSVLGYDVFDTNEFMPEFTCDVATKKGEKVDYAILKDGEPIILIEVKRSGMKLQKQQQGQLYRYFATNRCRIAILTNGISYHIFSDLNSPNIMDDDPFLSFNLLEDDLAIYLSAIKQFHKEKFDVKTVISKAVYQKYAKVVEKTLKQDLICPSDELVKYFLSRPEIKTSNRITSQMIEKHREITQKSMQKVFGVTITNTQTSLKNTDNGSENVVTENNNIPETVSSIQELSNKLRSILNNIIANVSYQQEDTDDYMRLHIYISNNKKVGVVKILKSDLSMQLRKTGNPTPYILYSVDDIKKYI